MFVQPECIVCRLLQFVSSSPEVANDSDSLLELKIESDGVMCPFMFEP